MATATYAPASSTVVVNGDIRPAVKADIFGAFGSGHPLHVFDPGQNQYVKGTVVAVSLESGFSRPDSPHHFNVRIAVEYRDTVEVYVRTLD